MSEKETKVTKQETLAALRNPGELYDYYVGSDKDAVCKM